MKNTGFNLLLSGSMRSGTTLMCSALNAHKEISLISDILTWFWKRCYRQFGSLSCVYELDWALYELEPYMVHYSNNINIEELRSDLITKGISYHNFYYALIEKLYVGDLAKNIGIKATHSAYNYEDFLSAVRSPLIVHMVRDPRAVYCSHKLKFGKNAPKSVEKKIGLNCQKLLKKVGKLFFGKNILLDERIFHPLIFENPLFMFDACNCGNKIALDLKEKDPDRIVIVKYEDLVADPKQTFKKVIHFLNLEWNDTFYNYANLKSRSGKTFKANTSYKQGVQAGYSCENIEKWRNNITREELDYFYKATEETSDLLGYH